MSHPSPIPPNGWPGQQPAPEKVPSLGISIEEALRRMDAKRAFEEDAMRYDPIPDHVLWSEEG